MEFFGRSDGGVFSSGRNLTGGVRGGVKNWISPGRHLWTTRFLGTHLDHLVYLGGKIQFIKIGGELFELEHRQTDRPKHMASFSLFNIIALHYMSYLNFEAKL